MNITSELLRNRQKLRDVTFVIKYDLIEQIQREIYIFESKFKSLFPNEAIDTRIPIDHNPSVPRFILRDDEKKRYLEVSQEAVVFKLPIYGSYSTEYEKGLDFLEKTSTEILHTIEKLISPKIEVIATFATFNFSLTNMPYNDIFGYFSSKFLNTNQAETPNRYTCSLTYHHNNKHLIKYILGEYEEFTIDITHQFTPSPQNRIHRLKVKRNDPRFKYIDYGLEVKIEVNNSVEVEATDFTENPSETIKNIFETTKKTSKGIVDFIS